MFMSLSHGLATKYNYDMTETCRGWLASDPLFLDTETTGLDGKAEIVEIAIINSQGTPLLDTLVQPTSPIPPNVTAIHGITNEMVSAAPSWHDIYHQVAALLTNRNVVIYNAAFDTRIIHQTNLLYNLPSIQANAWLCAMQMYQDHTGYYKWVKLTVAAEECCVVINSPAHRARVDALMCLGVVQGVSE